MSRPALLHTSPEDCDNGAVISGCGNYRYRLWRRWQPIGWPMATFIMLNPSTADAHTDDATIRKCVGFAKRWGMGGIYVGNLFAYRATKPTDMMRRDVSDPVGPENEMHLMAMCQEASSSLDEGGTIICAWGTNGNYMHQDQTFLGWCEMDWLVNVGAVKALRLTGKGMPEHPLYVPYDVKPVNLLGR